MNERFDVSNGRFDMVKAPGEAARFAVADDVRIGERSPVGHYRVPVYLRGKRGRVEAVIRPMGIDNEEEAFGRNAGRKLHYYRLAFLMTELWPGYAGQAKDTLRIEVFENWISSVAAPSTGRAGAATDA